MLNNNFDKIANEKRTIAVDLSYGKIRLMQFDRRGDSYVLRSFAEEDIDEEHRSGNTLTNPKAVGEQLLKMVSGAKPQRPNTRYAISLIPQKDIFLIAQDLPNVSLEEAESVLGNKINDLIPMAVSDVYWDWRVTSIVGNKMQVQIAAAPRELVDSYMKAFEVAGLVPLIFEPSAEAAGRVGFTGKEGESMLLAELTQDAVIVSISSNQAIVFATDIPLELSPSGDVNTSLLVNRIQEIVRFTEQQSAGRLKVARNARLYGDTLLVEKVLDALKYTESNYLLSKIKYQGDAKNPLNEYIPNLDEYVPAVGSAIRGLPNYLEKVESINLIPDKAKQNFTRNQLFSLVIRYTLFFTIDMIVIFAVIMLLAMRVTEERDLLQTELEGIQAQIQTVENNQLITDIEDANAKSRVIQNINGQIYAWDRIFTYLSEASNSDIIIQQVRIIPDLSSGSAYSVEIEGTFGERTNLLALFEQIRESIYFDEVALPLSSLSSAQRGIFEINAVLVEENLLITVDPEAILAEREAENNSSEGGADS